MKEVLRMFAVQMGPLFVLFAAWMLFMALAPCGCMSGCSPLNTPNRCSGGFR